MGKALSGKLSCPCDRSCYYDWYYPVCSEMVNILFNGFNYCNNLRYQLILIYISFVNYNHDTEDIYFFEVNTKYISSNVMKISVKFTSE